jgi:hypothetical protein
LLNGNHRAKTLGGRLWTTSCFLTTMSLHVPDWVAAIDATIATPCPRACPRKRAWSHSPPSPLQPAFPPAVAPPPEAEALPLVVAPPPVVEVAPTVDPPSVHEDPVDVQMADPPKRTGGHKPKNKLSEPVKLSIFDILNTFRWHWFLSRANLLTNVISAQKAEDRNLSWVKFTPQFHSHLVKCAVALVPRLGLVSKVKRVMFVFILELLNGEDRMAFFKLQKGGRKANNAQKEKRQLIQKRSRAAKREWVREEAKAAKLPPVSGSAQHAGMSLPHARLRGATSALTPKWCARSRWQLVDRSHVRGPEERGASPPPHSLTLHPLSPQTGMPYLQ